MDDILAYVGGIFYLLIRGYRCRVVRRTFVCVSRGLFEQRILDRRLFDIHRVFVPISLWISYLDVFDVLLLRLTFGRCRWADISHHRRRWLRRLIDFPHYGTTKQLGFTRPRNVPILTWFIFDFSLLGIPEEIFQTGPYFGGIQPL